MPYSNLPHPNADTLTLRKSLLQKKQELSALLEITQAINLDTTEEALYKIFQFTLLGQLNIRRIVVYLKEERQWQCVVSFGFQLADFRKIELPDEIIDNCTSVPCPVSSYPLCRPLRWGRSGSSSKPSFRWCRRMPCWPTS
jgi:sigma-B regulation protein RsbU (phosphoserine phosphatase)